MLNWAGPTIQPTLVINHHLGGASDHLAACTYRSS